DGEKYFNCVDSNAACLHRFVVWTLLFRNRIVCMMLDLDEAAAALKAGQIIAHPTEGVFGLAADAANEAAVRALLDLKKRPEEKGFIVMADSLARIKPWLKPLSEDEEAKIMNAT